MSTRCVLRLSMPFIHAVAFAVGSGWPKGARVYRAH